MASNHLGLGKGLDALIRETSGAKPTDSIQTVALRDITPNPNQPRRRFTEKALEELSASIRSQGLLQPILVRPKGDAFPGKYEIIAGERRWRASRLAGVSEIPALIKDISDEMAMEIALIENLQREDLDPVEEALGYKQLMERCNYTQETAAKQLSKSRSAVANSLRLLGLPKKSLEYLREGKLSTGHAKVILSLTGENLQQEAADIIVKNGLNVREAEALCKKMAKEPKQRRELRRPALPSEVELSLKEMLGTEVRVQYKEGKGSLNVSFYSDEQLKEFANLLGKYQKEK